MPRFLIEREVGAFDSKDIVANGETFVKIADDMDGVTWIRSYLSEAEGKVYCEYEAPSPEVIRQHAEIAGIPITKISLVAMEIEPAMFR